MRWARTALSSLLFGSVATLSACTPNDSAERPPDLNPATLNSTSSSIDDAIRVVVAAALGLTDAERDAVLLAAPFANSSILIIQRGALTGSKPRIANGRIMELPERFELLISDGGCWIRHANTQRLFPFTAADCQPDQPPLAMPAQPK